MDDTSEGVHLIPTSRQILEDLESACPDDVVFSNPSFDTTIDVTNRESNIRKANKLVTATKYVKEKVQKELPHIVSDISVHIDELKEALKTLSSES